MVGGNSVPAMTGRVLTTGLERPWQVVIPALLIVSIQGSMALLWKDAK